MASGMSEWEQPSTTRSISSALALDDGYLLLFTSDGFVVSSDVSTWCRSDVCPVVAEEVKVGEKEEKMHQQKKKATGNDQQQQPNITALSDLWNGTRVLGLKRVDASALLQSVAFKSTVVDYLLLIQQDPPNSAAVSDVAAADSEDDLEYLVVQLPSRRIVSFGNGLSLFGHFWNSVPCLANIVDIIDGGGGGSGHNSSLSETFDSSPTSTTTTTYIICRESVYGSLTLVQATLDLHRFHYSSLQLVANSESGGRQKNFASSATSALERALFAFMKSSSVALSPNITTLSLTLLNDGSDRLLVFESSQEDSTTSTNMSLLNSTGHRVWSGPLETVVKMPPTTAHLVIDSNERTNGSNSSNGKVFKDTAFEWAQFALILYTFAFLLGTFHLLLVGTETLSDYLHEGNSLFEWKKCEPVWMSKYEPPIQF